MIDLKNKKILLIDLDGTLIETISGETFPKGLWDMKFKLGTLHQIHNMVEHGSLRHCCLTYSNLQTGRILRYKRKMLHNEVLLLLSNS